MPGKKIQFEESKVEEFNDGLRQPSGEVPKLDISKVKIQARNDPIELYIG
jgi:hypothetical protein